MEPPGVCSTLLAEGPNISLLPAGGPAVTSSRERDREDDAEPEVLGGASSFKDNLQEGKYIILILLPQGISSSCTK